MLLHCVKMGKVDADLFSLEGVQPCSGLVSEQQHWLSNELGMRVWAAIIRVSLYQSATLTSQILVWQECHQTVCTWRLLTMQALLLLSLSLFLKSYHACASG